MGVHDESAIVVSEIFHSCNLNLDHFESLLGCSSAHIDIIVCILDVQYDELRKSVSSTEGSEIVLPIRILIDFVGSHGKYIYNLDEGWYFVDKDQGTKTSKLFWELFG